MSASLLEQAADVAAGLDLERVPPEVVMHVGHIIADTVGVSRGGAMTDEMSRLVQLDVNEGVVHPAAEGASASGSAACATVLTADLPCTTPGRAAFLNATAGTFLELDEGMRPTGHPGMHVVPAALAVAERRHADGAQLLRAVLAGYEVTSRLFIAFRLRYPVHPHGHFGAVGAAVAVAMLEDVDPVAAARVAGTTVLLPIWEACYEGATARNTWTGLAAEAGVRAAALVRAGFEGSRRTLEIGYGSIAGDLVDADAMQAPLDYARLGVTRDYFKLHSACALTHAAIDAVLEMQPDPRDVVSVQVETVSNNMKLDRQPHPNSLSGRFSLQYAVATAIVLGRGDPEAFTFRPEVARLAQKVQVTVAAALEAQWPDSSPARVTIETSAGAMTRTVDNPRGHHRRPVGADELRAKFLQLVGRAEGDLWWPRLTGLTEVQDVADVFARAH